MDITPLFEQSLGKLREKTMGQFIGLIAKIESYHNCSSTTSYEVDFKYQSCCYPLAIDIRFKRSLTPWNMVYLPLGSFNESYWTKWKWITFKSILSSDFMLQLIQIECEYLTGKHKTNEIVNISIRDLI